MQAQSEVLVLRQKLQESEKCLAEAVAALAAAERELEVRTRGTALQYRRWKAAPEA